jgi:hypothetical protein
MFSSAGGRIASQAKFHADAGDEVRGLYRRHARGNTLLLNRGNGQFEDVSVDAGVTRGGWAWGSLMVDWNGDGWDDLLVTNGYVTQADPQDL